MKKVDVLKKRIFLLEYWRPLLELKIFHVDLKIKK
jgi:hypothetical protein